MGDASVIMPITKAIDEKEVTWPKPSPPGPGATIGERFEYSLAEGVRQFLELFDEPLAELLSWALRLFIKVMEKATAPIAGPLIDTILETPNLPPEIKSYFETIKSPSREGAFAPLTGLVTQMGMSASSALLAPIMRLINYGIDRQMHSARPDPSFLYPMKWRNVGPVDDIPITMEYLGWDPIYHDAWEEMLRSRIPVDHLSSWYLRDKVRLTDFESELTKRGYKPEEIDKIKELLELIPPVTDIIRMAVREAFKEDVAREWGLDQDFDPIVAEWAEKVGLSDYWTNKYWRSHWILPSVLQGYEMLHRGQIDVDELKGLMRALDIMPGWRDKLINISYLPYTRVDTRRMHQMGILDEAGVVQSYRDQGYDAEKAAKMAEFTIAYNTEEEKEATKTDILTAQEEGVISREESKEYLMIIGYQELWAETYVTKIEHKIEEKRRKAEEEEKDEELVKERELTKSDILSAYEDKVISEGEAIGFLREIDYPSSVIGILISKVDFKVAQNLIREAIKTTKILYINQEIDDPDVYQRLGEYALPSTQIEELLTLWKIERDRKTERPTPAQLITFYFNDIIDETELTEQLTKHKYSTQYIEWFIANANYLVLERENAELERLEKEQQRIREKEFVTERKIQIADLNVTIQEWKVYIADLKVAALYIVDPEEAKEVVRNIEKAKAQIASLELDKAKVPVVPTE